MPLAFRVVCRATSSSGARNGSGRMDTVSTTLKMVLFTPIPRARHATIRAEKPGWRRTLLIAYRRSWASASMLLTYVGRSASARAVYQRATARPGWTTSVFDEQPRRAFHLRLTRQEIFFERRRIGHGRVQGAENPDRRVERLERFFLDDGRQALPDSAGPRVFVNDQDTLAVTRDGQDGLAIERREAPQVEHAGLDACRGKAIRYPERHVHVRTISNDGDVVPVAPQRRPPNLEARRHHRRQNLLDAR